MNTKTPKPTRSSSKGGLPTSGVKIVKKSFNFKVENVVLTQNVGQEISCALSINGFTKQFNSIQVETKNKGKTYIYSFVRTDAVIERIEAPTNSLAVQLFIRAARTSSNDGEIVGELITTVALTEQSEVKGSATISKQKRNVGSLSYEISKIEEAYFEDSASEDGDQAAATPSPMPTGNRGKPVDRVLDFGQLSGPRPARSTTDMATEETQTYADTASFYSSFTTRHYLFLLATAICIFMLGIATGFLPLVLIIKQETAISASGDMNTVQQQSNSSALSKAFQRTYDVLFDPMHPPILRNMSPYSNSKPYGEKVGSLLLAPGQVFYAQWQVVGSAYANITNCLVWSKGAFGSGYLTVETCSEVNSWWKVQIVGEGLTFNCPSQNKCLHVKNVNAKQSSFTLQSCRNALWSFTDYLLIPQTAGGEKGAEETLALAGVAVKDESNKKKSVLFTKLEDDSTTKRVSLALAMQSVGVLTVEGVHGEQFYPEKKLFHTVIIMKENPLVVLN